MIFMRGFASHTIKCTNIMRQAIIFDNKMPSLYVHDNFHIDDNLKQYVYSIEHIFPRSHLNLHHSNDMHNVIKTINTLNVNRSNYKFVDNIDNDKNWIKLDFDNYVNHKRKLFLPNQCSRGFISRAILYMCNEYNYKYNSVISKEVLAKWFFDHPPSMYEKYHNEVVRKMQNKNNIFIANYNKKKAYFAKFIESL
jgi:hypothetical protein